MLKTCPACGEEKTLDNFYNNKAKKDGKQGRCIPCFRLATAESRVRNRATYLYNQTRRNAAARGIQFTLTKDWFEHRVASGQCELTGISFVLDQKRHPFLPSPDRIDTNGAYSPDNCRLVLWIINCAKGTSEDGEFRSAFLQVAEALREQD